MLLRPLLLAAAASLVPLAAQAGKTLQVQSELTGQAEVPPVQTRAIGHLEGELDQSGRILVYTLTFHDLSGPPMAIYFEGPAHPGQNGRVEVRLRPPFRTPLRGGTPVLNEQQLGQLRQEKWYVTIATRAHPQGELRGQVLHGGP